MERHLLSTDQEMIPARNAVDARVSNFVLNDELLLSLLKAFAQCTRWLHATRNAWCFQSVVATNSSPGVTRTAPDTPPPHLTTGIISRSVGCRRNIISLWQLPEIEVPLYLWELSSSSSSSSSWRNSRIQTLRSVIRGFLKREPVQT